MQITSFGMAKPIKMKTEWDPQSNFEQLVLKQIDEMERLEFNEDAAQDGKTEDENRHDNEPKSAQLKDGSEQPSVKRRPARAGLQYELI